MEPPITLLNKKTTSDGSWSGNVFSVLPPDGFFDSVARLATEICETPYAVVVHTEQQGSRLVSTVGMETVDPEECIELCVSALGQGKSQEINNLSTQKFLAGNLLVRKSPYMRFFKGVPLMVGDKTIGMLAVMDDHQRNLSEGQNRALERFSHIVSITLSAYCVAPPVNRFASGAAIERDVFIVDAATLDMRYSCHCSNGPERAIELRPTNGSFLDLLTSIDLIAFTGLVAPLRAGDEQRIEFDTAIRAFNSGIRRACLEISLNSSANNDLFVATVSSVAGSGEPQDVDVPTLVSNLPGAFVYRMHREKSWITDYVSDGFQELTGVDPKAITGTGFAVLQTVIHPEDVEPAWKIINNSLRARKPFELTYRIIHQLSQETCWIREQGRGSYTEDGQLISVDGVVFDVTRQQRQSSKLGYQASHDYLTGMCNRREFEHRLSRALESARAKNSEHALCFLDLDQFKTINDSCGHRAGDELLRKLNSVLSSVTRQRDTLARLGGDEFGILMEHCTLPEARRVANSVREGIRDMEFEWEGNTFKIGVSIGITKITADCDDAISALQEADAACYIAKEQGGNRIHVSPAEEPESVSIQQDDAHWVSLINRAIAENEFQLYRQAIVSTADGSDKRGRCEVLLRLRSGGESISPAVFLPAAEVYQIASRIDRWVIRNIFKWLSRNPRVNNELRLCSINLSAQTLTDEEFPAFLEYQLQRYSIPAERICFEITESVAVTHLSRARYFLNILSRIGFRFTLDDFGNGLSSFAYLKNLPVDFVKIDGIFVRNMLRDSSDQAVISAITHIAHLMGKEVIAEWVEDEAVHNSLSRFNVDYAQGFSIEKPQRIELPRR